MVARTAAESQGRPNKFTDVGVIGRYIFAPIYLFCLDVDDFRKTGLMIKDTGRRDSAGLEDMDAFFSPAIEKSPRKGSLSPRAKRLSYKTKFQAAIQSDGSVPMSGTSSSYSPITSLILGSIREPKEVLASRKSLLAQRIAQS